MAYCDRCDRSFWSEYALVQHEQTSSMHNVCGSCGIDFPTWLGLKEHFVQSPRHYYCQHCNEHFNDKVQETEHYEDCHDYCRQCNKIFKNNHGLTEHYRQSPSHHYCLPCNRHFMSASNLQSHLNSAVHRPKDVKCPFNGCGLGFVSGSALILHLESGTCRSGVNRAVVNRYVREHDRNNLITDPSRLLTNGNSSQEISYYATSESWNGHMYECYLCHGEYRSLSGLNQHLSSPHHHDKVYFCPYATCRLRFSSLSALWQHIESERCGVSKFKPVQQIMDSVVGQMRRIAF